MRACLAELAVLLGLAAAASAHAQSSNDQRDTCLGRRVAPVPAILAACNAVIAAGQDVERARTIAADSARLLAENRELLNQHDAALRANAGDVFAHAGRCQANAILGRDAEAIADCDAALRLRPGDPWALETRGFVRLQRGEIDAAIADYDAALKGAPAMPEALFGRGVARRLKRLPGGDEDISAARAALPAIAEGMARVGLRL